MRHKKEVDGVTRERRNALKNKLGKSMKADEMEQKKNNGKKKKTDGWNEK